MPTQDLKRIVVATGAATSVVTRAGFLKEDDLQVLLESSPEMLEAIGSEVRFVLVGREVSLQTGFVDLLFLDSDGLLTVVETKLRTNPESRREVVGQVLDYAAEISGWTISEIQEAAEHYYNSTRAPADLKGMSFHDVLATRLDLPTDDPEEAEARLGEVIAKAETALAQGRLRVVVAIDEQVESLERIVRYLSEHSDLQVLLLQVNRFSATGDVTVLVPSVLGDVPEERRARTRRTRSLTRDGFIGTFPSEHGGTVRHILDLAEAAGGFVFWGSKGISIRVQSDIQKSPFSVAWFFPPDTPGWMRTKDLSFGWALEEQSDLPESVRSAAADYCGWFENCGVGSTASSKGVRAWALTPAEATQRLDDLTTELVSFIRTLKGLKG